jgi:lipid-binding SYLF domain-containing protein
MEKVMFRALISAIFAIALFGAGIPVANAASVAEEKAEYEAKVKEVLADLYRVQPSAKKAVQSAAGYAVFSNFGTKILFAGGGSGKGIAYDNKSGKKTYMNMIEVQAGLGLGIKKFGLVWVFAGKKQLNQFVNSGWEVGAQATAAAKYEDDGGSYEGAVPIAEGIFLYQITDAGLAAELTVKGTKYYKDGDLN